MRAERRVSSGTRATGVWRCRSRRAQVEAIRAEHADEGAEAVEAEIAERNAALDVPLNLRIDKDLDARLKQQAAAEQIPMSALVRRLLRRVVGGSRDLSADGGQVEAIARRVMARSTNA